MNLFALWIIIYAVLDEAVFDLSCDWMVLDGDAACVIESSRISSIHPFYVPQQDHRNSLVWKSLLSLNSFWIGGLTCSFLKGQLIWEHREGQYRTLPSSFSGWELNTPCKLLLCCRPFAVPPRLAPALPCSEPARSTLSRHFGDHTVCRLEQLELLDNVCEFLAPISQPHCERRWESQHWSTGETHLSLGNTVVSGSQNHPEIIKKKLYVKASLFLYPYYTKEMCYSDRFISLKISLCK